jgi:hypothetical protein
MEVDKRVARGKLDNGLVLILSISGSSIGPRSVVPGSSRKIRSDAVRKS